MSDPASTAADPSVSLEMFPLFRDICMRLAKAAEDPYSLQERDPEAEAAARAAQAQAQQEQQEQQERAKARTPQGHSGSGLPPLAPVMLGMEEDADLSTWDMMEFEQRAPAAQSRPTQLQEELVSLSQRLKRIVAQTYDVADSIPGGEWSVRQQQQLIQLLDSQRQRQSDLEEMFVEKAGLINASAAEGVSHQDKASTQE